MDKMRGEFELFAAEMDLDTSYIVGKGGEFVEYFDYVASIAFESWKASRSALNAELDVINARIKHECEKADYLKVVCAKIIDDINSIQIERF